MIYPDISKWNIIISEYSDISSINYNCIKELETDSLISEKTIKYFNLSENLINVKDYNDIKSYENNNSNDNSKNEFDDYYDNFYT